MSWSKKIITWEDEKNRYYSIVFTWDLYEWSQTVQPDLDSKNIIVGGPAVKLMPELVPDWVQIGDDMPVLHRHNPLATRTSTGCIRLCKFCAVPITEGELRELSEWKVKPIVIDNNLFACSRKHFEKVIKKLSKLDWCDFNQGLDCRLFTKYHAVQLTRLKNPIIRLAFDHIRYESDFLRTHQLLKDAGIPNKKIRVYVLIGYYDRPENALYRLNLVKKLGLKPFPMRYQPIDTKIKNSYVAHSWTNRGLIRFMSYWVNFRHVGGVPFGEYVSHGRREQQELLKEN